uniref:Saposin B-type domain-containing protein n=1 Tax=Caenorhabditis tropicalis TaxID=1561998 RepID=A0A1I7UF86_9PELO
MSLVSIILSPWFILISLLIGIIVFLLKLIQELQMSCAETQRLLKTLKEEKAPASEDLLEVSIPEVSDWEEDSDEDCQKSTGTSGYNSEADEQWDRMMEIIKSSPVGPVCMEQTYLSFKCINTGFYVKAVVDDLHSLVHVVTWKRNDWIPSTCRPCIDMVRKVLESGKCEVPLAADIQATKEEMENAEEVRRMLKKYYDEDECEEDFSIDSPTVLENEEDGKESEVAEEEKIIEKSVDVSDGMNSMEWDDENKENFGIEKPIGCLPTLDDYPFDHDDFEYDYSVLEEAEL